jgi:DNA polymerase II small subunit
MIADPRIKILVNSFLDENLLISPDLFDGTICPFEKGFSFEGLGAKSSMVVLNKEIFDLLSSLPPDKVNWRDFDRLRVLYEKRKEIEGYLNLVEILKKQKPTSPITNVMPSQHPQMPPPPIGQQEPEIKYESFYREVVAKLEVQDFIGYLNARYKALEGILSARRDMQNVISIGRLGGKKEREEVAIIGMIRNKEVTMKNKHIKLTMEDPTGNISVLVNKNNPELYAQAKDLVEDEVIGIRGTAGDKIIFSNSISYPDVPLFKEVKKYNGPEEVYGIVLSDFHVGSINFLDKEMEKGISWIRGEIGTESQRELAAKAKYIFVLGDLVDGVGVYPDQNKELIIKDIYEQYEMCASYLKELPRDKKLIIIPGNHDAVRIEEPQPPLYDDIAAPLFKLPNTLMLSNPCNVNLLSSKDFPGFDFLLYHGYSFTYYADNVESIRQKGGVDRADLIMQFLLQKRHLAPTHTSTIYNPDSKRDPLVIDKIPDFFMTGHLHKTNVSTYKNITLISGSCWQSKTSFMEKMGIHPEPARVPVINFNTREVKIMRFGK